MSLSKSVGSRRSYAPSRRTRLIEADIEAFKRGIATNVALLTKKSVTVIFQGTAFKTNDFVMYLPDPAILVRDNMTESDYQEAKVFLMALRGGKTHEVGHHFHSDLTLMTRAVREHGRPFSVLFNATDDIRMELAACQEYQGDREAIHFVRYLWMYPKMVEELAANPTAKPESLFPFAVQCLISTDDYENHILWPALAPEAHSAALSVRDLCVQIRQAAALPHPESARRGYTLTEQIWARLSRDDEKGGEGDGEGEGDDDSKTSQEKKPQRGNQSGQDDPGDDGGESDDGEEGDGEGSSEGEGEGEGEGDEGSSEGDAGDGDGDGEGEEEGEGKQPDEVFNRKRQKYGKGWLSKIEAVKDFKDLITEAAKDLASKIDVHSPTKPYLVYDRTYDKVERVVPRRWATSVLADVQARTQSMIGPLSRKLQAWLRNEAREQWVSDQEDGHLDPLRLHLVPSGAERVFRTRSKRNSLKNTVVGLLVDCSASMGAPGLVTQYAEKGSSSAGRTTVADTALLAAYAFGECLNAAKVPFAVWSFTTRETGRAFGNVQEAKRNRSMADLYSRFCYYLIRVAKDFNERWDLPVKKAMTALYDERSDNLDCESVEWACLQLLAQKQERKVLFVFSDGNPVTGDPTLDRQKQQLKYVVEKYEALGVETVGIGILTDAPTNFYRKTAIVRKIEDLPGVVLKELQRTLTTDRRRKS